jgi:hypothetical protein
MIVSIVSNCSKMFQNGVKRFEMFQDVSKCFIDWLCLLDASSKPWSMQEKFPCMAGSLNVH